MAQKSRKQVALRSLVGPFSTGPLAPLCLGLIAFLVYLPSLHSDFVYDARPEIFEEGFIPVLANIWKVLSLQVLSLPLNLHDRPGQLLFLMLNYALWGARPWGYHLASNLLHAANVALLFALMRRLVLADRRATPGIDPLKLHLSLWAATLIFALHPIAVEPVSGISYSSDLLVTFFTLLALLSATSFRPDFSRRSIVIGAAGIFFAFAAVTCKESGLAAGCLLILYWRVFRRGELIRPWRCFIIPAAGLEIIFLAARLLLAPPNVPQGYLGGSFFQVFAIQPRLWVFMMGQLLWPTRLSADYTFDNLATIHAAPAFAILLLVLALQAWLACKSRIALLGVAVYWLGLATVSNFTPLYRFLADRFYYLPLAGVSLQLLALLILTLKFRRAFWVAAIVLLMLSAPLALLTLERQKVFANEIALWTGTLQVSPLSAIAHNNLGKALADQGRTDEAVAEYEKSLAISPDYFKALVNLGNLLLDRGQVDQAIADYTHALALQPNLAGIHNNLANALLRKNRVDDAVSQFEQAVKLDPNLASAHFALGLVYLHRGHFDRDPTTDDPRQLHKNNCSTTRLLNFKTRSRSTRTIYKPTTTSASPSPRRVASMKPSPNSSAPCN